MELILFVHHVDASSRRHSLSLSLSLSSTNSICKHDRLRTSRSVILTNPLVRTSASCSLFSLSFAQSLSFSLSYNLHINFPSLHSTHCKSTPLRSIVCTPHLRASHLRTDFFAVDQLGRRRSTPVRMPCVTTFCRRRPSSTIVDARRADFFVVDLPSRQQSTEVRTPCGSAHRRPPGLPVSPTCVPAFQKVFQNFTSIFPTSDDNGDAPWHKQCII